MDRYGLSATAANADDVPLIADEIGDVSSASTSCCAFFAAGVGRLGIRNNCAECKAVVIAWTPNNPLVITKHKLAGFSQVVIDMQSQTAQLIGEEPC